MEKFREFELNLKWFSGYITEPKVTYSENGTCRTEFAIPLKHKKDDEAIFLNCIIWNKKAEIFAENYKKGDLVTVAGTLIDNEYKEKKYTKLNVSIYN